MNDTNKKPVTAPVESDPCTRSFDPESHRFEDEDDACKDGENTPSVDGKPAR